MTDKLTSLKAAREKAFVFVQYGDGVGAELVVGTHDDLRTKFINSTWCGAHDDLPEEIEREAAIVAHPEDGEWEGYPRQVNFSYEDGHIQIIELTEPSKVLELLAQNASLKAKLEKLESERDNWGKITEEFKGMTVESVTHSTNLMNEVKALRTALQEAREALGGIKSLLKADEKMIEAMNDPEHCSRDEVEMSRILLEVLRRAREVQGG